MLKTPRCDDFGEMPPHEGNFLSQGVPSESRTGQVIQFSSSRALCGGLNPRAEDVGDPSAEDIYDPWRRNRSIVSSSKFSKSSLEGEDGVLGGKGVVSWDGSFVSS